MRIKGLVLLGVMIVVSLIYLLSEDFNCSGRTKMDGKKTGDISAVDVEKK
jgi:hypothetical protein